MLQQLRSIFAPVTGLAFNANQEVDCINFLAQRSVNTEIVPVADESQLRLAADGRIVETGYRFNVIGFAAVCSAIAPGLSPLFQDISGELLRRMAPDIAYDIPAAVSIYNTALRLRFDSLRERSLLVDHRERAIAGFLGLDHKMLPNDVFLKLIQEELTARQPTAMFHRAELIGRELRVYYMDTRSRRADIYHDKRHVFASGWYFSNREDAGNAVHALPCLFTKFGIAVEPTARINRLSHVGADLVGRTVLLIGRAAAREIDMLKLQKRVQFMLTKKLGFTEKKEEMDKATNKWVHFLITNGIARPDAKHIVRNAALVGADIEARDTLSAYTGSVLKQRTVYDLVCATLRFSKAQPSVQRARAQGAAMRLFFPKEKNKQTGK